MHISPLRHRCKSANNYKLKTKQHMSITLQQQFVGHLTWQNNMLMESAILSCNMWLIQHNYHVLTIRCFGVKETAKAEMQYLDTAEALLSDWIRIISMKCIIEVHTKKVEKWLVKYAFNAESHESPNTASILRKTYAAGKSFQCQFATLVHKEEVLNDLHGLFCVLCRLCSSCT